MADRPHALNQEASPTGAAHQPNGGRSFWTCVTPPPVGASVLTGSCLRVQLNRCG